jgi:hypothetical protein
LAVVFLKPFGCRSPDQQSVKDSAALNQLLLKMQKEALDRNTKRMIYDDLLE